MNKLRIVEYDTHISTFRGAMKEFLGPLDIPELQWQVTNSVRHFANERGLEHESLYHDEYRWIVFTSHPLLRLVEIAAFTVLHPDKPAENKLFFIPNVFRTEEKPRRRYSLPPDRMMASFEFLFLRALGEMASADAQMSAIQSKLRTAWERTAAVAAEECTHPVGTEA